MKVSKSKLATPASQKRSELHVVPLISGRVTVETGSKVTLGLTLEIPAEQKHRG